MTQTTTSPDPATVEDLEPADFLMNIIVTLLSPIFLGVTGGNVRMARMAAIETLSAYNMQNLSDLIAIAQIVAYGLVALSSLSLSMADDLSLPMILRLRGNANACTRSAEQNRRAVSPCPHDDSGVYRPAMLGKSEHEPEPVAVVAAVDDKPAPEVFLNDAAARMLEAESQARLRTPEPQANLRTPEPTTRQVAAPQTALTAEERRNQQMWAIAMVKESGEITDSIPGLPPSEHKAATLRAAMLSSTAHRLLMGDGLPGQPLP
jgi:hypothetical protein